MEKHTLPLLPLFLVTSAWVMGCNTVEDFEDSAPPSLEDGLSRPATSNYAGCDMDYAEHGRYYYKGFSVERSCGGNSYILTADFIHEVPADIGLYTSHARTVGKLGLDDNPLQPVSLQWVELGTFTNPWGVPMKRYQVAVSHTLTEDDYCFSGTFTAAYRIATDCAAMPTIRASPHVDHLTPNTYKVYHFGASNSSSGGVHKFTVFPGIFLCFDCHEPALGGSPEHIFEYRAGGTTSWTVLTRTDYFSFDVFVPAAGFYEFRSKGKLKPDGTYSEYTPLSIVEVQ